MAHPFVFPYERPVTPIQPSLSIIQELHAKAADARQLAEIAGDESENLITYAEGLEAEAIRIEKQLLAGGK